MVPPLSLRTPNGDNIMSTQQRFPVILSGATSGVVHTFTWAASREDAAERIRQQMDSNRPVWDGWTFIVADAPAGS